MDFLRRHLFFIICGVVSATGIAVGVMGIQRMPKVQEEMKNVAQLYDALGAIQNKPVGRDRIEAEQKRIDSITYDKKKMLDKAESLYGYKPPDPSAFPGEKELREGVLRELQKLTLLGSAFPNGNAIARSEFRRKYLEAMDALLVSLRSGLPATPREIAEFADKIENERVRAKEEGLDPASTEDGLERTPAGVLTRTGVKQDAVARANIAKAQQIFCYALSIADAKPPLQSPALDYQKAMANVASLDAPTFEDVWWAQIGYWVQKDVVSAIAAVNEAAAEAVRKRGEEAWVGNLPVKEVISIRVSDEYVSRDSTYEAPGAPPGGYDPALPPGTPETVFTHSGQADWYEVRQFTVKLIMDQREIPALVARLCTNSFHTLLRVAYEAVPPNKDLTGKIYGPQPTVNVVMDFETIMLGDLFRPLMPTAVCEYYGITCPERAAVDEESP